MQDPNAEPNPGASKEAPASDSPPATAGVEAARTGDSGAADKGAEPAASGVVTPAKTTTNGNAVVEWFWQGGAVKTLLARGTTLTKRGQELLRRARLAHELGTRVLEPAEPLPSGNGDAIACELYRESIEWSLAAHQEQGASEAAGGALSSSRDTAKLWDTADPELLSKALGKGVEAKAIREDVVARSFRDFAELDSAEQARLARSLRLFAENLTNSLDGAQNELDRIWLRRLLRIGGLVLAVAVVVLLFMRSTTWAEGGKDMADEADWTASSVYSAEPGCPAPAQECAGSPNFFIHTNEEDNPWLMFDLKKPRSVSAVRVENRLDCCYERAFPLIVEVSDDAKTWKEVAQQKSDFSSWKAEFPTVETRYVRLRIDKKTNLHFSRVRILP